jgi:RNA polymerase sigma-70 factor (ECF subfamily)
MDTERFKNEIIPARAKLLLMAVKLLGDTDDAEDAVQDTMLRAWEQRSRIALMDNPAGYTMQMLRNLCLDRIRATKMTVEPEDVLIEDDADTPFLAAERADAVSIVRRIIALLPKIQRLVIEMRDIEGYELEEIAAATGSQIAAVTVNLSRARKTVRDRFIKINNYKNYG